MTDLATMLVEDAVENAEERKATEIAKKMLKRKTPIQIVSEDTGLDESTIKELQAELDGE